MTYTLTSVSVVPALVALALALLTTWLLERRFGAPPEAGRFSSIDGLRGYLAFAVFIFHASAWQLYRQNGEWKPPPSNLYSHLGQSSVLLFFMITAFLFFTKIIDARQKPIDWLRLFVSRVLRLTPLYAFAMLLLFLAVAYLSGFTIRQAPASLAVASAQWLGFTLFGSPDLNGFDSTWLVIAGVTWSLQYEWLFYLSLPILALIVGGRPPLRYLAIGAIGVIGFVAIHAVVWYLMAFMGGIVASMLSKSVRFRQFAQHRAASALALGSFVVVIFLYPSPRHLLAMALLTLAFALIASGTSLFGLLNAGLSRTFGEMSYSIYLLHGFILFVIFRLLMSSPNAAALSVAEHWMWVILASPFVVILSFVTYRFIELPPMLHTAAVAHRIRWTLDRFLRRPRPESR